MDIKMIPQDTLALSGQNMRNIAKNGSAASPDAKTRAAAHKVATEFEAMFAGMMLKSMRSSLPPDKLTGGGKGEEIFQSLLDQEYASAMAQQGGLGIAKSIEKVLLDDASRKYAATARRDSSGNPSPSERK
jgi:flagellar protein FlgJ